MQPVMNFAFSVFDMMMKIHLCNSKKWTQNKEVIFPKLVPFLNALVETGRELCISFLFGADQNIFSDLIIYLLKSGSPTVRQCFTYLDSNFVFS